MAHPQPNFEPWQPLPDLGPASGAPSDGAIRPPGGDVIVVDPVTGLSSTLPAGSASAVGAGGAPVALESPLPATPFAPPPGAPRPGAGAMPGAPQPPSALPGAPDPAPVAPQLASGPPKLVTESSQTTSTTSGIKQTPQMKVEGLLVKDSIEAEKLARANENAAKKEALEGGQQLATDQAKLASDQRALEERQQQEAAALQARHDKADAAATQQAAAAREAVKGFKFKDYWADKSSAARVGSALAVALGALGASLTKTPNFALQILDKKMDDDHRSQVERLQQLKDDEVMARTGIADAREARASALAALNIKGAAGLRVIKAQMEEAAARSTDANYKKMVAAKAAEWDAQAAERDKAGHAALYQMEIDKADKFQRTSVTSKRIADPAAGRGGAGAGGKAPTESQAKTALLAQQMLDEITTLDKSGFSLSPKALDKLQSNTLASQTADKSQSSGWVGNAGTSLARSVGMVPKSKYDGLAPGEQRIANAWDNLIEKYARVLTGAGMPEGEANRMAVQNAPHAGDSPQVLQQKMTRMRNAASQMMSLSGGAATMVQGAQQAAPPTAAPSGPQPGTTRQVGGKTYRFDGRGWLLAS